ncbi:hypothetical protein RF11_12741 [Thelohanellus kitauei]|uniref:Uncharacterized protein n=1 Tax=Thelohanellus kitauei TaxID=669202 RepID=A0A0C2J9G2_THEKT|nr:hypothetical protein RF11_12741 [Thelohanellus kitauei]
MYRGQIMKELDEWEGEAYFEAAQAVDFNEIPQISAIKAFKLSIQCFLRIKSRKAYLSFVKNQILKAIQHWVEYGYLIRNVFRDRFKSVEFYQQADLLRIDHDIPHRCAITTFDINKYNILEKALDDFQKSIKTCTDTFMHRLYVDRKCDASTYGRDVLWGGTLMQAVWVVQDSHLLYTLTHILRPLGLRYQIEIRSLGSNVLGHGCLCLHC